MSDREFINNLISVYFSNATNPYQTTLNNAVVNRLNDIANKLEKQEKENSKYKQLEEQLGCPLDVVFKALTNGVYYEDVANCMKYMVVDLHLNLEGEYVLYFDDEEYLLTKNYKKTWWLMKNKEE